VWYVRLQGGKPWEVVLNTVYSFLFFLGLGGSTYKNLKYAVTPPWIGNKGLRASADFNICRSPSSPFWVLGECHYTLPVTCIIYLFIYFGGTRVWTQDFVLAKLVLYHLSHTASPFWSGYFGHGSPNYLSWLLTEIVPISASQVVLITGVSHWHPTQLYS
jgi:hypothetical protein